jgi:hypothetical protein
MPLNLLIKGNRREVENQDGRVCSRPDTGLVSARAKDDGGISPFERSTARGYGGMGLGHNMPAPGGNGRRSDFGRPTEKKEPVRFYFTLPVGSEPKPKTDHHRSEVVLLTNHSADAGVLIRRLEKSGFEWNYCK